VEVEVGQVGFDHFSNSPVVLLRDKETKKTMPIWIGPAEAQAIAIQLQGQSPPRPLTHDLLRNILEQVGVEFDRVLVTELKGSTYYARIHLVNGGKAMEIDSRPSDAIALALGFHRPIFIARDLFEAAQSSEASRHEANERTQNMQRSTQMFGLTVQELTDALATHFELPDQDGVLVTDVERENGGARLQRGDVIVAVQGVKVREIPELRRQLEKEQGRSIIVRVRRNGREEDIPVSLSQDKTAKKMEEDE
jgi:bifunctional DNase/RNase